MITDVSDDAPLSLDVGISWMKVALDWSFAGLTLVEQSGVWQLHWVDWHPCLGLLMIRDANLAAILKADPKSEVCMPDAAEIALLKEAITAKHSLLVDCYCMCCNHSWEVTNRAPRTTVFSQPPD